MSFFSGRLFLPTKKQRIPIRLKGPTQGTVSRTAYSMLKGLTREQPFNTLEDQTSLTSSFREPKMVRFLKNSGVEAIHGNDRIGRFNGPDQRLVVMQPEVTPEPQNHGGLSRGSHVGLCKQRAALVG
jgi:hypothetical protein